MLKWTVWNRTGLCIKMELALNNLQSLICHICKPDLCHHINYTCNSAMCDNTPPADPHYLNQPNYSWPFESSSCFSHLRPGVCHPSLPHKLHNRGGGRKRRINNYGLGCLQEHEGEVCDTFMLLSVHLRATAGVYLRETSTMCYMTNKTKPNHPKYLYFFFSPSVWMFSWFGCSIYYVAFLFSTFHVQHSVFLCQLPVTYPNCISGFPNIHF